MLVLVFICRSVFLFEDVIQQYAFPSLENLSFMSKALEMTNVNIYYNFRISLKLFTRFSFIFLAHPVSTSSYFSTNSPQSPRCSTPLFSKQRRTRPFIACELCRQRAFESLNEDKNEKKHISYHRSTTLVHYQNQTSTKIRRRRSSIDQLLVWIV